MATLSRPYSNSIGLTRFTITAVTSHNAGGTSPIVNVAATVIAGPAVSYAVALTDPPTATENEANAKPLVQGANSISLAGSSTTPISANSNGDFALGTIGQWRKAGLFVRAGGILPGEIVQTVQVIL